MEAKFSAAQGHGPPTTPPGRNPPPPATPVKANRGQMGPQSSPASEIDTIDVDMMADKPTKATPKLVAKPTKLAPNPAKCTENPAKPIAPALGIEDDIDMIAGQPKLVASLAKTAPNPAQPTVNLDKRTESLTKPVEPAFGTEISASFDFQPTSPAKQAKKRKLDTLEGKGPKKSLSQRPTSTAGKVEQANEYIQQAL